MLLLVILLSKYLSSANSCDGMERFATLESRSGKKIIVAKAKKSEIKGNSRELVCVMKN